MFVGSHYGDSQLVRLPSTTGDNVRASVAADAERMEVDTEESTTNDGRLEVVNSFTNLAPILDFVIVDIDSFGSVSRVL
jgi:hypothetical protein